MKLGDGVEQAYRRELRKTNLADLLSEFSKNGEGGRIQRRTCRFFDQHLCGTA